MQLVEHLVEVEELGGGFGNTRRAYITDANMGLIFDSLTRNFYSDPIGSICRELANNLVDAHIQAGRMDAIPMIRFDAKERILHFIDEGTGLSPELMNDVYLSFGESTKREDNTTTGAFGMGSKSPLSYTDSFYITTRYNGIEYQYLFSKLPGKLPELDLLSEEPTDDANGTNVWFYLKPSKYTYRDTELELFTNAFKHQLKYFPTVIYDGLSINNKYTLYRGEHYISRPDLQSGKLEICFGQNVYPIDFNLLGIPEINCNAALYFNIGELRVTPNREQLIYDDQIIALLHEKIRLFKEELVKKYQQETAETDDIFEYFRSVHRDPELNFGQFRLNLKGLGNLEKLKFSPIKHLNLRIPDAGTSSSLRKMLVQYQYERGGYRNNGSFEGFIRSPKRYYYTETGPSVPKNRFLCNEYTTFEGTITLVTKNPVIDESFIPHFYDPKVLSVVTERDPAGVLLTTIKNPKNIDYVAEITEFYNILNDQIKKHTSDYDTVEVIRRTGGNYNRKEDEQITVNINDQKRSYLYWKQIDQLAQKLIICDTFEQANDAIGLLGNYLRRVPKTKYQKRNTVFAVLTVPKKYKKQFQQSDRTIMFEDLWKSELYKRASHNYLLLKYVEETSENDQELLRYFHKGFLKPYKQFLYNLRAKVRSVCLNPDYVFNNLVEKYGKPDLTLPAVVVEMERIRKVYSPLFKQYQQEKNDYHRNGRYDNLFSDELHLKVKNLQKLVNKWQTKAVLNSKQ